MFSVVLDLSVPTHSNGGAIAQRCVPARCHRNNGYTQVHTQSIHVEEAQEGQECDHVAPPAPELPRSSQSVSTRAAPRQRTGLQCSGVRTSHRTETCHVHSNFPSTVCLC